MNGLFVAAIDTNIGKTVTSAIICKALNADYWKPLQCGDLTNSDTINVKRLSPSTKTHPEAYALKFPVSPNKAAKLEGVEIQLETIIPPSTENTLVVEGAGGCLVPLNDEEYVIDIPVQYNLPVILVSKNYLGSINHTLLSIEAIRNRKLTLLGVIMVGDANPETERSIEVLGKTKILAHIDWNPKANPKFIEEQATKIVTALKEVISQ